MEKADYMIWFERAKKKIDVKKISENFLDKKEVVENHIYYIQKEKIAWNKLICSLEDAGYDYMNVEDMILQYGGTVQAIYFELGIKIGARLEAQKVIHNS